MLKKLKKEVYLANLELVKQGLVIYTWGNVSAIDRERGLIVIKPSGVPYEEMTKEDMVVLDLEGNVIEGNLNPSSDTPTHIELYKTFKEIGGIVHTHSKWATIWAQSGRDIPFYGTTHADTFYGDIPCTRELTQDEVFNEYEKNTGKAIIETFKEIDENAIPGVLCHGHGPFSWGSDPMKAVYNAKVLEEVADMAFHTELLNDNPKRIKKYVLDKHYLRKHGDNAYYGQNN